MSEATPSISFERLNSQSYMPSFENALDISSYLKHCDFELTETESSISAAQGEYLLFKLEELKYGFLSIEIKASRGDIVDVSLGQFIDENDFPLNADDIKKHPYNNLPGWKKQVYKIQAGRNLLSSGFRTPGCRAG